MEKRISDYKDEQVEEIKLNQPQQAFDYENGEVILKVKHLKQYFRFGRGRFKYTKAVHDISFDVYKGEVFGLVGESGCGKTTTGRSIIKLYRITSGDVYFKGVRIAAGTRWNEKEIKFTRIHLGEDLLALFRAEKEEIKPLSEEHNKLISEYKSELNKGKEEIALKYPNNKENPANQGEIEQKQKELDTLNASIKEKIDAENNQYNNKVKLIKEKYEQLKKEKTDKAEEIIKFEKQRIKQARHDDKHCNDDIAAKAVELVKAKYEHLFKPENLVIKAKLHKDDEESKKILGEYEEYKKELKDAKGKSITRSMQMIFQDPIASLNPRMTIRNIIAEGLIIRGIKDKGFIDGEVKRVLELVGLLPEHANRYPHEFSGGQRQRIGIARAIIMNPELIIADEPVSALDVSIQAQVINLLNDLRNSLGLTILFIAHNLSVVKYFCDRIAVMYYGELMEVAKSEELFKHPLHPYTKSLLSAVPHPDPNVEHGRQRIHYRPNVDHDYSKQGPTLREIVPGHFVRCNDEEMERYLKEIKEKDNERGNK